MPLSLCKAGDVVEVIRIGGSQDIRKHLEDLGFVVGSVVTVIAAGGDGNIIVNLKESRLAITEQMGQKVTVTPTDKKPD